MAVPLRRRALSRRRFLRGAGAALALPWLSAMSPALARASHGRQPERLRAVFILVPNGQNMAAWTPEGAGEAFTFPFILEPLEALRDQVTVITGLALDGGRAHGDGPGDHARAAASYLTAAHPKKTGGGDIRNGISVDQVLARRIGGETRFASLQLGCEGGRSAGVCDSGYSCAYSNTISWRSPFQPLPKEHRPRAAFERLFRFEAGGDPATRERDRARTVSVLDCVLEDVRALTGELGPEDRRRLDDYASAVREVEIRIRRAGKGDGDTAASFEVPSDTPKDYREHLRLMYDVMALALRADLTRVVTFMTGDEGSGRSYRFLQCPDGHHDTSHHGRDPRKLEALRTIGRWHVEQFARFVGDLRNAEDEGSSVLERSVVVFGGGLSDGDRHNHDDLPVLVAGGARPNRGGRHLRLENETPMANLHLAILQRFGVEAASFGDSFAPLAGW